MGEIGSEFWNVPITDKNTQVFPESTQWYLSGRSALKAILKELRQCQTAALPSWCCDSMVKPFVDAGLEVRFYPVYWNNSLTQEVSLDSDVLLVMDYFGYTGRQPDLGKYRGTVIRDTTHSIISASYTDADYYFGSLRKWCGFWTGGYVWSKDEHELASDASDDFGYTVLRERAMQLKDSYIHDLRDNEKAYLELFDRAEETLERVGVLPAAERDVLLAQRLDVEFICKRRRTNAKVLMEALKDWLIFPELKSTDCPMFVPVLVPDGKRDRLRRYLIKNDIYCPIHWPVSTYHKLTEKEQFIYDNELSLVCDQRYTETDMNRIVETINRFMEE